MIDSAHDFGCMGPTGTNKKILSKYLFQIYSFCVTPVGKGTWEMQGLTDLSNVLLMAGGSKCLSTNLGFIGC